MTRVRGIHLTEKAFMGHVTHLAKALGWTVFHPWLSVRSSPGFPDLVLVKAGQPVLYCEVKTDTGKVTPAQQEWLTLLASAKGTEVYVFRPRDWEWLAAVLQRKPGASCGRCSGSP